MEFSIQRVVEITGGNLTVAPCDEQELLTGLSWDSRTVEPGWIYAALAGERVDGHRFVRGAFESGARLALVSDQLDEGALQWASEHGCAVLCVDDVARAIAQLAKAWRNELSATVIAVTGSVGKTTTKSLVRSVLGSRFKTHATKGNFNNELGAPLTVLCAPADCEMLVVEMGMDDRGQIASLCSFARPDMGVITNVGVSHMERLGSRESIALAKAELLEALPDGRGRAFLNGGNDMTEFMRSQARLAERGVKETVYNAPSWPNSSNPASSAVWAERCMLDEQGHPTFDLCVAREGASEVERQSCSLALRGMHNISNACAAAAVGLACGMSLDEVVRALAQSEPEAGRQELKRAACGAVVFDDAYNASPDSMKASLAMLAAYEAEGRRIAVLGDMGELGAASERGHYETGRAAAQAGVDVLVCVGALAQGIAAGARDAGLEEGAIVRVADADEATHAVAALVRAGDVVLVKASHFMGLDRVVGGIVE